MRSVVPVVAAVVVLSGCSLNFHGGSDDGPIGDDIPIGDDTPIGDDGPIGGDDGGGFDPCSVATATCTDGVVTLSEYPGETCAMWDPPVEVYACAGECTTDYVSGLCLDAGCSPPSVLCDDAPAAPLPAPFACDADGATCTGDATSACGGIDECGTPTVVGSCTCAGGVESCTDECADGLCGAAAVQAALVGTWSGTIVTPWATYSLRLTIRPDGHYYSECPGDLSAFYYGTDGGGDARRFHVIGQTALGATAIVRIFFGSESVTDGLARGLRIQDGHLTFDLFKAWIDCTRYAQFDLVREP